MALPRLALLLFLLFGKYNTHGQSILQRMSVSSGLGNNFNLNAQENNLSLCWSNRFSFTPIHLVMLEAEYTRGELNGYHVGASPNSTKKEAYFATYQSTGFIASLNLSKLFTPKKSPGKFAYYLYAGFGRLNFQSILHQNNNPYSTNNYRYKVYTNILGCRLRYQLNPYMDLMATFESRFPQTYYLDANPEENDYDSFLSLRLEVSYKINCSRNRKYMEWLPRPRKSNCPSN